MSGTTSPPVAVADVASVTEDQVLQASGNVLSNDSDPSGYALSVAAVNGVAANVGASVAGTYGTLTLGSNGSYTYVLNNSATSVQALNTGQSVTDTFNYTLTDGHSYTTTTAAQNNILYSEAFDNAAWIKFASAGTAPAVSANVGAAPQGTGTTADQVTLSGTNVGLYQQVSGTGTYTFSVWAKLDSGDGNFSFNYYDGTNGNFQHAVATSAWQHFTWTFTGNGAQYANVALMHDSTQTGTGTFEFWGAELNPGSTASPYVATTSAPVSTTVTGPATIGSTLTVTVNGMDDISNGTMSFAGASGNIVANLSTHQWSTALKVLPLGDSITYGWSQTDVNAGGQSDDSDGYRGPLWNDFVAHGALIDFVGPNSSGLIDLPDPSHAGYPGYRSDQLAALLPGLVDTYHPDAVLLMAGVNDVYQLNNAGSSVGANITAMIETVASKEPNAHIYVATITPTYPAYTETGEDAAVNAAITSAVQQAIAEGLHVSLVDMSSITSADLFDGTHPSPAGYAKMAQIWYNAIESAQPDVGGTPGGTAGSIAAGVGSLTGGSGGDLLTGDGNANTLNGADGNDRLVGGGGNDILIGGTGADQFVFTAVAGNVTVQDYTPSASDVLVFQGISGLSQYATLSSHITHSGTSTIIDLTSFVPGLTVTLANYTGTVASDHVLFA